MGKKQLFINIFFHQAIKILIEVGCSPFFFYLIRPSFSEYLYMIHPLTTCLLAVVAVAVVVAELYTSSFMHQVVLGLFLRTAL
jgi:hypothetical protein